MNDLIVKRLPDKSLAHKLKRYIRRACIPNPDRFFSYNLLAEIDPQQVFHSDYLDTLNEDCFLALARKHYSSPPDAHVTDRLLYLDMKLTITDNDLRKVTGMVEAAGLQVLYPFLDRDLVDFTATIPATLKVKSGKNRYIFKRAMQGILPRDIIQKPKHGMGLPAASWFKTDESLANLLHDTLFTGMPYITNFIKAEFLHRLRPLFTKETTPFYGDNLWIYLIMELWFHKNRPKPLT
jgi:asparagine synthase (glutamine-hydrolysing)